MSYLDDVIFFMFLYREVYTSVLATEDEDDSSEVDMVSACYLYVKSVAK